MVTSRFGRCGLALLLSAASTIAYASDALPADAAEKKDQAGVRTLLEQRVDVNACQVDGMTALHWAAYHDLLETAQLLVAAGANVKAANRYGVRPLSLACMNGNTTLVKLLLETGADPNTSLRGGSPAGELQAFSRDNCRAASRDARRGRIATENIHATGRRRLSVDQCKGYPLDSTDHNTL